MNTHVWYGFCWVSISIRLPRGEPRDKCYLTPALSAGQLCENNLIKNYVMLCVGGDFVSASCFSVSQLGEIEIDHNQC